MANYFFEWAKGTNHGELQMQIANMFAPSSQFLYLKSENQMHIPLCEYKNVICHEFSYGSTV